MLTILYVKYTLAHGDCEGEITYDGGSLVFNLKDDDNTIKLSIGRCIDRDIDGLDLGQHMAPTSISVLEDEDENDHNTISNEELEKIMTMARDYIFF